MSTETAEREGELEIYEEEDEIEDEDSDGGGRHPWSVSTSEYIESWGLPEPQNKRQWLAFWREMMARGYPPPAGLRNMHLSDRELRILHFNPRYWPMLHHIDPQRRGLPIQYLARHLAAGLSQDWDWMAYAECAGERFEDIVWWLALYCRLCASIGRPV